MQNFETSLLREKVTITNAGTELIVLANRITWPFPADNDEIVIRGRHLYACVRLVSKLLQMQLVGGSIVKRIDRINWDKTWNSCLSEYDKKFQDNFWIAIYHNGTPIYTKGEHHPFLDMVEKLYAKSPQSPYEETLNTAEDLFKKTGKDFTISHDTNIAMLIAATQKSIRCGTIHRNANKTTTFSFTSQFEPEQIKLTGFTPFISASASFVEASQLCFTIGRLLKRQITKSLDKKSQEYKQLATAQQRLRAMEVEITNLELAHKITYRPERPDFNAMIAEARY